ncbi:MAG: hypothetical protein OEQ24_01245 [Gammaproteobacteria bacterium]|nr:hypothetical protein [Gammaproteobacteria bacterium]
MKTKLLLILVFSALGVSSVSLGGCASKKKNQTLSSFEETTRLYGRLLRWREFEGAVNMIRHQDESTVDISLDGIEDLRVTDYEIKRVVMGEDLKTAIVEADISYYYETTNVVKEIRDTQNWWYLEEAEKWFLDDNLPAF